MKTLWPPLALLETELFSPSDALIERWRTGKELPADLQRALETDPESCARRAALGRHHVSHPCDPHRCRAGSAHAARFAGADSPAGRLSNTTFSPPAHLRPNRANG